MFSFITNFFSDFLFTLIIPGVLAGLCLLVVSTFIPAMLSQYKIPTQLLGLLLIVFFVFQTGRYVEVNKSAKAKLENAVLVAERETKSEKVNTEILIQYVDRVKVVEKIKEVPVNVYVTKEADVACRIDSGTSNAIGKLLNDSARGIVPRTTQTTNGSTK